MLCNKRFNIDKSPKHDGYQQCLFSIVYKFFDTKSVAMLANKSAGATTSVGAIKSKYISNELQKNHTSQLLENLKNKNYTQFL